MRHFRTRTYAAVAGAVALTMLAAACSSSSTSGSGTSTTGPQALAAGWQGLNPGTGAPQRGGTLNQVGISDVQYMDYDLAYYTTDIQLMRRYGARALRLAGDPWPQHRHPRPTWPPPCPW